MLYSCTHMATLGVKGLIGSLMTEVACHMGSHSVTCHPTQANTPRLNPCQSGWYLIYLPRRDGRLSRPKWLDYGSRNFWTRSVRRYIEPFWHYTGVSRQDRQR